MRLVDNSVKYLSMKKAIQKKTSDYKQKQNHSNSLKVADDLMGKEQVAQRTFSDTRFSGLPIQTKLSIGQPNDKYEREADSVADRIMRMPQKTPNIQTKCAACEEEEKVRTKPLRMKSDGGTTRSLVGLSNQLNKSKGNGRPLPIATNQFMSQAFSRDFSGVKIHTGADAVHMNQALNARAFTYGAAIYFNKNQYHPESPSGKKLLAHELTHVVQQGAGTPSSAGSMAGVEAEAAQLGNRAAAGQAVDVRAKAAPHVPLRQVLPGGEPLTLEVPEFGSSLPRVSIFRTVSTTYNLTAFPTDSAELNADHLATIERVAASLNDSPLLFGGFVTIFGETDRRGTEEHNLQLGQRRADAARNRLLTLVTDQTTRDNIRAYSIGEPAEGQAGDVPEFRQVSISITRRVLDLHLTPPGPTPNLTIPRISIDLPERFRVPITPPPLLGPRVRPHQFPPWMWRQLPPVAPPAPLLNQVSRWLTRRIGRRQIARVGGDVAAAFGFDRRETIDSLNEAMVSGGETALKELLRTALEAVAGPATTVNPNAPRPVGPTLPPDPAPPTIFNSPSIPF